MLFGGGVLGRKFCPTFRRPQARIAFSSPTRLQHTESSPLSRNPLQFGGRLAADLDALSDKLAAAAASQARFVRSALGLGPGACAVVTNGRLLELPPAPTSSSAAAGPASTAAAASAEEEHSLEPHDFELLELYAAQHQYSEQVATLVRDAHQAGALAGADASAVAAMVSSALAAATPEEVRGVRVVGEEDCLPTERAVLLVSLQANSRNV